MTSFFKPATLLPILIGATVGAVLFVVGYSQDAPGMCAIGLAVAFFLIMRGVYNAGIIKKGFLAPILLFCYGAGGILLSTVLLFDGEFEDMPGLAFIGIALGIILIIIGAIQLRKAKMGSSQ